MNLAEVVAKMADLGMDAPLITTVLDPLRLRSIHFDTTQARANGMLRPLTKALELSLGDRACLALAAHLGATTLTTDRAWSALVGVARVELAR